MFALLAVMTGSGQNYSIDPSQPVSSADVEITAVNVAFFDNDSIRIVEARYDNGYTETHTYLAIPTTPKGIFLMPANTVAAGAMNSKPHPLPLPWGRGRRYEH